MGIPQIDDKLQKKQDRQLTSQLKRTNSASSNGIFTNVTTRVAGLVLLLLLWQFSALIVDSRDNLPGPLNVAEMLWRLIARGSFFATLAISIARVVAGFVIAFVLSIIFGLLLGRSRVFERMFGAYVFLGITVPGLAYGVISLVLLGLNEVAAVTAVVLSIVPLMILNVWEGTKAIDSDLLLMARAFKIPRLRQIRHIFLPSLSPYLLAALRLGFSLAWKLVVVVELLGLSSGVGYEINKAYNEYSMVKVLAWTIGFSLVIAVLEFGVFRPIERHVLRWRPDANSAGK